MLLGAGSCIVFVPVDVIKQRLQIQGMHALVAGTNSPVGGRASGGGGGGGAAGGVGARVPTPYKGSADALKTIWKTEGLRGIYKVSLSICARRLMRYRLGIPLESGGHLFFLHALDLKSS